MKRLKDSTQVSIASRSPMAPILGNNFKTLDTEAALLHLSELVSMLRHAKSLFEQHVLHAYHSHDDLTQFVDMLLSITNVLENRIERGKFLGNEGLGLAIDPTESGLPIFVRDFHFLNSERKKALADIGSFPDDKQLVDDALFSLFRGVLPVDVIEAKMTKNIYGRLAVIPELQEIRFLKYFSLGKNDTSQLYSLCVERLEETYNIPRFYTIHFRVPIFSNWDDSLLSQLKNAFLECTKMPVNNELSHMANAFENINGICVDQIQRVDIGPFYNRFTMNSESIDALLSKGNVGDSILSFKVHSVHRVGETKKSGMGNWFKALTSGDWRAGSFSKTLVSPTHLVMPHRLIQKAHYYDVKIDNHVKMFGLSAQGDLIESAE